MTENHKNSDSTLQEMSEMMTRKVPFSNYLNMSVLSITHGHVTGKIPYNAEFLFQDDSGIMHGGIIATAIDNISGLAALTLIVPPAPMVTLDLRIDYSHAPAAQKDIIIDAECYRTTSNVSFVRAIAHNGNKEDVIAHAVSVFMRAQLSVK